MSSSLVIQLADGTFRTEPSSTVIGTERGVYVTYDIDAREDDYTFYEGAEVVGSYYGDLDDISDPTDGDSWLTDLKAQRAEDAN